MIFYFLSLLDVTKVCIFYYHSLKCAHMLHAFVSFIYIIFFIISQVLKKQSEKTELVTLSQLPGGCDGPQREEAAEVGGV